MFEVVKKTWNTFTRDTKRAILAIMGLAIVLAIVVIATVSKSASIREPKAESIWDEIRLPTTVVPSHYDVKLKIDMTNERFTGSEDVYIDVTETTAVLMIHINNVHSDTLGYEMNVTQHSVHRLNKKGETVGSIPVKHAFPYSKNSFYVLKMKEEIVPGKYKIYFEWESRLVRGLDGIYISSYKEDGLDKKVLASQMEPLAARKVMPCFDEPSFKATFSMEIIAEKIYPLVLWNMPEESSTAVDETWNKFLFQKSVKMSTYLLAFVVADFKCTDPIIKTTKGVKVRTCGRKETVDAGADLYSAQITATIIDEYERFYGTDFPLPKIDSVAVPDFSAGAMENWGLILYRETALLWDPKKDTYNNKARVNTVVAHELAHQWFGNLVTMKWWNDLWLNEGFASYVEWIGTVKSEPKWNYLDFQTYSDKSRAFAIDSYMSSRPASIDVSEPDDITAQFDSISYSKGSALLVQAKMFMDGTGSTTENFEDAIRSYVKTYEFGNAEQTDLYEQLNKIYETEKDTSETRVNIVEVMNTWTLQMNFPVLEVRRYDDNHIAISQRRFLISGSDVSGDKESPYGYQWYVPIEYMTGDEIEFAWLKPHDTVLVEFDFSDLDSFIRLNMNSAGYYIVNYSFDLNERLTKHIGAEDNYKVLTTSEAQGLLYDTFLLISAGYKPMLDGVNLIDLMLPFEKRLVPLKEISRQISRVAVHISEDETLYKQWKDKYRGTFKTLFDEFGAAYFKADATAQKSLPTDADDNGFQDRLKVVFAVQLACAYEVEECVNVSIAKFDDYKNDIEPESEFKSTILNTVMSVNVTDDSDVINDWKFLWAKFLSSDSASEKQTIYQALGLIQDNATLKTFSEYCLDSALVRPSDSLYILGRSIAQTKLGREVSWDFLVKNWERLTDEFTDALFAVDAYIAGVLSNFADQKKLDEITEFFSDQLESLGPGRAAYESAVQSIKGNIGWLEKHKSAVQESVKTD